MGQYLSENPLLNLHQAEGEVLTAQTSRMRLPMIPYIGGIMERMQTKKGRWQNGDLMHQRHTRGELIFYEFLQKRGMDLENVAITDQVIAFYDQYAYSYSSNDFYADYSRYLSENSSSPYGDFNGASYWLGEQGYYQNGDRDQVAFLVPVMAHEIVQFTGQDQLSSIGWALWKITRDFQGKVGFFKDHKAFACANEADAVILAQMCEMLGVLTNETVDL